MITVNRILKKWLPAVAFFVGLHACQESEKLPEGILDHDQMVDLMVDVELLQAELKYDFTKANRKIDPEKRFEEVFKENGLTKDQFNKNLEYYGARPLQMKEIYVEVIEELSQAQAELN